jgi:hypothetical protein
MSDSKELVQNYFGEAPQSKTIISFNAMAKGE